MDGLDLGSAGTTAIVALTAVGGVALFINYMSKPKKGFRGLMGFKKQRKRLVGATCTGLKSRYMHANGVKKLNILRRARHKKCAWA